MLSLNVYFSQNSPALLLRIAVSTCCLKRIGWKRNELEAGETAGEICGSAETRGRIGEVAMRLDFQNVEELERGSPTNQIFNIQDKEKWNLPPGFGLGG